MSKIAKILTVLGVFVLLLISIYKFINRQEKPVDFEYSMITANFDKVSGKVSQEDSSNQAKYLGLLQFKSKPDSKNMASALVCAEQASNIDKVDLYMPDMGHGSQPPTVSKGDIPSNLKSHASEGIGFGCINIGSMQLFMPGIWQVRLFYHDGKVGLFNIDIKE